jgi:hypothetical protein
MALDSYANLKTALADWANKAGLASVGDKAAEWIALFEAQANRELDVREMTATATLTISGEDMGLPCDFAGVRSFRIEGSPAYPLEYAKPEEFDGAFGTGKPTRYTVTDRIVFDPVPDAEYEARLRYRRRIPALSASVATNWLLRKHPDAYLYGALSQALIYFRDDDRQTIRNAYAEALSAIEADEKRTAYPSTVNARAGRSF